MNQDNFFSKLDKLYKPSEKNFSIITVPKVRYMMLDGEGAPEDVSYQESIKHIFMAIHPLRKIAREKMGKSFLEPPLECLWWSKNNLNLTKVPREDWNWRLMVVLGDWMTAEMINSAILKTKEKLGDNFPNSLRFESYEEGKCVQIMLKGSPKTISESLEEMYKTYLPDNNLLPSGPYHEIYLKDINRVEDKSFKMITRQPVKST